MATEIVTNDKRFHAQTPDSEFNAPAVSQTSIMMEAVRKGFGAEQLEVLRGMFELQRQAKKDAAQEDFVNSLAAFKADPPEIIKSKKAGFDHRDGQGRTEYSYADLAIVARACNEGLSKHGLSASWETSQDGKNITVSCILRHKSGHSEKTSLTAEADQSGKKNPIQAIASTISYLEKYTLLAITGLAAQGMDNDGNGSVDSPKPITEQQVLDINTMVKDLIESEKLKDWDDFNRRLERLYNVKVIGELNEKQAEKLIRKLENM